MSILKLYLAVKKYYIMLIIAQVVKALKIRKLPGILSIILLIFLSTTQLAYADVASNFTLEDIDGNIFSLSDFRGKIVLLDFFATWCNPCKAEIVHLKTVHDMFREDLVIISISIDPIYDSVDRLRQFREDFNITWTLARDMADVAQDYNVGIIPTLYIIDQEGYIRYHHVGETEASILIEEISIIPEFNSAITLLALMVVVTIMLLFMKKSNSKLGKKHKQMLTESRKDYPHTYTCTDIITYTHTHRKLLCRCYV